MDWIETPYRHTQGTGFFSDADFEDLMANLPPDEEYRPYNKTYPNRLLYQPATSFWRGVWKRMQDEFGPKAIVQLARDLPGYTLGPHTDKPTKLATYLFYLTDIEVEGAGTTVFVPTGPVGGTGWTHHGFEWFEAVKTAPYVPNGYFGFERSDKSFHGVFPAKIKRNTLQVAVYK